MKYNKQQITNIKNNLEKFCKPFTKIDIFRTNTNETPEHNKKISDLMIVSFDKPVIKEIMKTESDERFLEKDYMGINKIKVKI